MESYKTILKPSPEIIFKEKKSKFFAYAIPIRSEDDVKLLIESIRKKHPAAGHVCYAWQIGVETIHYRANDDGEPNNSAGMPIYGQIQSYAVTNILIAVARIFGGKKLGVGGLISAYRDAAKMALEASNIVERTLQKRYKVQFDYTDMNKVMRLVKRLPLEITSQEMEDSCKMEFLVDKSKEKEMLEKFAKLHKALISEINH